MDQIPSSFYVIIGTLILANVGSVITVLVGIGRLIWFIAKLESRVGFIEKEHSKDINAAHEAIRELKQKEV